MRMKQVAELAKVNMIYANPQMVENKRNKEAKKGTPSKMPAYINIIWQNLLLLAMFILLFGFLFSNVDLVEYPGMFTTFTAMFTVMALLQGFYIIYNLFYESKDLVHYLPLPFQESEIFTAKLVVLAFMMMPYILPVLILFVFLGTGAGNGIVLSVLASLLLFLLLVGVVFSAAIILVHAITKLPVFHRHKQVITTILYAASSFGMIAVYFFLSSMEPSEADLTAGVLPDTRVLPFLDTFHMLLVDPSSFDAWLGLVIWLVVLAVLAAVIFKWVIPNFYQEDETAGQPQATEPRRKKRVSSTNGPQSVNRTLFKYNMGLLQDGTLMMQFLSSKILLPVIFLGPNLLNGLVLDDLPLKLWPAFFFGGFIFTLLTLNAVSIVGVIISLDRENFLYMKSLPFSMTHYMRFKFLFAFVLEFSIPALLALIFVVVARVPVVLALLLLLGFAIGTFAVSHYYFVRDYRFLTLEWQNLSELFNRGGGTFAQAAVIFGSVFLGILGVFAVVMGLLFSPPFWQNVIAVVVVIIPLAISVGLLIKYKKTFWPQFEQ